MHPILTNPGRLLITGATLKCSRHHPSSLAYLVRHQMKRQTRGQTAENQIEMLTQFKKEENPTVYHNLAILQLILHLLDLYHLNLKANTKSKSQ